jgi:GNAT superfamily N-acetyltransferase
MSAIPLEKQDINLIHTLDFKTYQYAFDIKEWGQLVQRGTVLSTLAVVNDVKVGLGVWERGAKGKPAYIHRLGVLPNFRNKGIGRKILSWIDLDLAAGRKEKVRTVLSQASCLGPRDPDDVSGFMKSVGFTWVEEVENAFTQYGKVYPGLVFERKVN